MELRRGSGGRSGKGKGFGAEGERGDAWMVVGTRGDGYGMLGSGREDSLDGLLRVGEEGVLE
jgi:hypothetical protein